MCRRQHIFASDSKLYSLGASCASAALHHVKKQTGVWLHRLTEIIRLPSGISSKVLMVQLSTYHTVIQYV